VWGSWKLTRDSISRFPHSVEFIKISPSLDLLIGGTGSQGRALESEASRLGLSLSVRLLGRLDQPQIASYMRGSRAVIIPSRLESLGIVALEARIASSTIIASKVGGLLEALEGYPVLWIEPDSAEELRRAIISLCSGSFADPSSVKERSVTGTGVLSWNQAAEMYLDLYKGLQ
jgi:glycosyltransferase involved in cell wall biosynthesis